jgi:hypothetical protein
VTGSDLATSETKRCQLHTVAVTTTTATTNAPALNIGNGQTSVPAGRRCRDNVGRGGGDVPQTSAPKDPLVVIKRISRTDGRARLTVTVRIRIVPHFSRPVRANHPVRVDNGAGRGQGDRHGVVAGNVAAWREQVRILAVHHEEVRSVQNIPVLVTNHVRLAGREDCVSSRQGIRVGNGAAAIVVIANDIVDEIDRGRSAVGQLDKLGPA